MTDLVVGPVVESGSDGLLVSEDPVTTLRLHRHARQHVVKRDKQPVPDLVKKHDGLSLSAFREHTCQPLYAHLKSHVPNPQHLVA